MFRKKKSKRLYIPTKSRWYMKPRRRRATVKRPSLSLHKIFTDFLKRSPYLILVMVAMLILILFFSLSSYFSIKNIEVVRKNFNIATAKIENELNAYVGRNIFFLPKRTLHRSIQEKFPEFETIKVRKVSPNTISIDLESYPMIANLKIYYTLPDVEIIENEDFTELNKAIEDLSDSDPNLVLANPLDKPINRVFDLEGFEEEGPEVHEQKALLNRIGQAIFDKEESLELINFTIQGLTQPVSDREEVISPDHIDYLVEMMKYFTNQMGINVASLDYLPIPREARIKTEQNLALWFSVDRPYKDQIDKLKVIYEPAELNKEDIAYIDLRIREKVIYCPRKATCDKN